MWTKASINRKKTSVYCIWYCVKIYKFSRGTQPTLSLIFFNLNIFGGLDDSIPTIFPHIEKTKLNVHVYSFYDCHQFKTIYSNSILYMVFAYISLQLLSVTSIFLAHLSQRLKWAFLNTICRLWLLTLL